VTPTDGEGRTVTETHDERAATLHRHCYLAQGGPTVFYIHLVDNSLASAYPVTLGLKKGLEAEVVLVVEVALNVGGWHSVMVHAQCLRGHQLDQADAQVPSQPLHQHGHNQTRTDRDFCRDLLSSGCLHTVECAKGIGDGLLGRGGGELLHVASKLRVSEHMGEYLFRIKLQFLW